MRKPLERPFRPTTLSELSDAFRFFPSEESVLYSMRLYREDGLLPHLWMALRSLERAIGSEKHNPVLVVQATDDDKVNKPAHYNRDGIEVIDYILSEDVGYFEGNIVKYLARYPYKNGIEDLRKAEYYLKQYIAVEEWVKYGAGKDSPTAVDIPA